MPTLQKRDINNLQSITITRGKEGYYATARFKNYKDDFIVFNTNKEFVYRIIDSKFNLSRTKHVNAYKKEYEF